MTKRQRKNRRRRRSFHAVRIELRRLDLKPGDVLAVTFHEQLNPEAMRSIGRQLREVLPAGVKAIALLGDVDLAAISPAAECSACSTKTPISTT